MLCRQCHRTGLSGGPALPPVDQAVKGGLSGSDSGSAVTPMQLCGVPIADVYVSRSKRFPTAIAGHSSRTCQWWPGRF